jgi:nicotinamidase-related amidase
LSDVARKKKKEIMVDQPTLHRSAEMEDLAHLTPEEINKPLNDIQKKSKQALILVDIQNDYFPGGKWTLSGIDAAADNAARLLAAARASGDLVVYIRHETPTPDAPFFVPGSTGAEIHLKVQNRENEHVIVKNHINSFRDTKLKDVLDHNGIRDVVICGAMSHMCIDGITRAANDYGYNCILIHDACASRDLEFNGVKVPAEYAHAAFMAALEFGYAKTISTHDFLKEKKIHI